MSNLVFVSGDFSSGTTLLFTLFRKTGDYYCLYEPLHEKLPEYLIYPLKPDEHHPFVEPYFSEYKHFDAISRLFRPDWAVSNLYLPPTSEEPGLCRYFSYLIGSAFARRDRVLLKENRIVFRLGWIREHFPKAKIIHIYRDPESQWKSIVRRGQEYLGREDIGQNDVMFAGFNVARWCEDLKHVFPELDASHFRNGHDRFLKLWELSYAEQRRHADISIDLRSLTHDFEPTCRQIGQCVGYEFDVDYLKDFVVRPEERPVLPISRRTVRQRAQDLIDRVGRKYARARLATRAGLRGE